MNFLTIFSLFLLTLFFFPVTRAFDLGQIQTWINAMFAALFYFWLKDRQIPGGVLLGLMSLIKPQYVIIAVWGALRRKWQFLRSFAFVFLGGIALSFLLFGGTNNLNYLEVLSYLSQHGEAFFPNQSMNGLLNRLFLNGDILIWQAHTFPPYHPVVYWGSLIFGIGLIVFALSLLGISRNQGGVLDLSIIAMAATMASPIAWEHHYGILLPIYVYLFSMLWRQKETKYLPALSFSYALSSNYIPAFRNFAYVPGWNILLSYLFVGAFVLLLILFKLLQRQPREGTATI